MLCVAQALNAAAGPLVMGSCSMLSALWFPPETRATATAVAYSGGNIGQLIGFAFGPLIVQDKADGVAWLLAVELGMAVLACVLLGAFLPERPLRPVSAVAGQPGPASARAWLRTTWRALTNRDLLCLALLTGTQAGVIASWAGLIDQALVPPLFSTTIASATGIANTAACLMGNAAGGVLADRCFRMRLKRFLVLIFAGAAC
eukprot:6747078-Prymnesium_polylepis.1